MNTIRFTRLIALGLLAVGLITPIRAADTSSRSSKTASTEAAPAPRNASGKVDINTADAATLETLPGVGPQIAHSIIAGRPFSSVDDLERVSGIGPARLQLIRDRITASSPKRATASERKAAAPTPTRGTVGKTNSAKGERGLEPTGRPSTPAPAYAHRVDLNTATRAQLEALPEIGPVKAQAIIDARPFSKAEDVMRVKGIKEATFEAIKDQITVR